LKRKYVLLKGQKQQDFSSQRYHVDLKNKASISFIKKDPIGVFLFFRKKRAR
jgi:hypothetical protein